ncbi:phosphoglycerate dehydrogenase [Catalinimonas sp. 4WD22]|uniref:phosphoglycerate dehydrogenase n=1 Tax=Catalinimonas locisalis TaxID=3133978 RepID=UPI003100F1F4
MRKVLITAPYLKNEIHKFEEELREKGIDFFVYPVKERVEEDELLKIIEQYEGIVCGDDRITAKVIDQAKNLKVIVKWGTGIDSINKVYAEEHGIPVRNTLNAFTEPVSDSVLAIMLAFSRKLFESDRIMKSGQWEKAFGLCLSEVSLGIIGLGNIGKAVARKIRTFGTKVYANDIIDIPKSIVDELNVEIVPLEVLLEKSDFVNTCCTLNETSHHLINSDTLSKMKSTAYLINVARGPIVNEPDLIKALEEKRIAGAGLDVFEHEPLPINSPLRSMDNCILSSHNVNASPKYWNKVHRNTLDMLYEGLGIK